jgi:Universal stress protein family
MHHVNVSQIDELEPTLTIVGTRGRSSLKGVLLGSFSNYLVTKSSAPVMVARKKLKKPRSQVKVSSNKIRLSNNLMASALPGKRRSLTQARID